MKGEPLAPDDAKARIRSIIADGHVTYSRHAQEEMAADGISLVDAVNVLRGGVVRPAELERGTWRYRVQTGRLTVVIAFRSESELAVVTAWRMRR